MDDRTYVYVVDDNYGMGPAIVVSAEIRTMGDKEIRLAERVRAFGYGAVIRREVACFTAEEALRTYHKGLLDDIARMERDTARARARLAEIGACRCGAHILKRSEPFDPPGMAPTLCVDGVQHTPTECQRFEAAHG